MAEAAEDSNVLSGTSELAEEKEDMDGVSSQDDEGDKEKRETSEEEEPKSLINLQRDLTELVTNIPTAADAKIVQQRAQLDEARRLRQQRLENDAKSCQEQFEQISRGWPILNQKAILQDLQKALTSQQQLCDALIQDKKKLISDLQQELKLSDEHYVKNLRTNAEEINLMIERMEDQIKILTKAYREELDQIDRVHEQELDILLTKDKTEWEEQLKKLWDLENKRLMERTKKVENYEEEIHDLMLENVHNQNIITNTKLQQSQAQDRVHQQVKDNSMLTILKQKKIEEERQKIMNRLSNVNKKILSLEREKTNIKRMHSVEENKFMKQNHRLSEEYKRYVQKYEQIQMEMKHFAVADAKVFEDMWLMSEAEVKRLVERALDIDSVICKQHLGIAWERPHIPFLELSGPIQPQKLTPGLSRPMSETGTNSQETLEASAGRSMEADTEGSNADVSEEGRAVLSESSPGWEEGNPSRDMQKEIMELLCDETDFLMEDKILKLLASLDKEEQTAVKLGFLFSSLAIEDKDESKLADFLLKYEQRQREQNEGSCTGPSGSAEGDEISTASDLTSEVIHRDHILPALKSFLEQRRMSRECSAHGLSSTRLNQARDTSDDAAYWATMGDVISEDKFQLWDAAEITLNEYHAVLTEISDLIPETERLKQKNTELRMQLQQRLTSAVD
ncbi:unnamed protein product [Menidia menidia]|uniref:Dynein regulatory complex protein 1 n=1 Tax=Menidia menidia TaxID=238744 RepID=A0A8S4B1A2_9TELE|nr:unnamed protein product [Menidia menidia]